MTILHRLRRVFGLRRSPVFGDLSRHGDTPTHGSDMITDIDPTLVFASPQEHVSVRLDGFKEETDSIVTFTDITSINAEKERENRSRVELIDDSDHDQDERDFGTFETTDRTPLLNKRSLKGRKNKEISTLSSNTSSFIRLSRPVSDIMSFMRSIHRPSILRDMVKAVAAFALAASLTYLDFSQEFLGFSCHLAAVAILTIHPAKSFGAMTESVLMGFIGAIFALLVCLLGLLVASSDQIPESPWLRRFLLVSLIFGSTFILSFIRARSSRPPVYTGTIIAHVITLTVLTSIDSSGSSDEVMESIRSIFLSNLAGVAVSLISNLIIWPSSASGQLRRDVAVTILSLENLLGSLTRAFLSSNHADQIEVILDSVRTHQNQIIHLGRSHAEGKLEILSWFRKHSTWDTLISSLNRLTRHLGGMKSGVLKKQEWSSIASSFDSSSLSRDAELRNEELLDDLMAAFKPSLQGFVVDCQLALLELENICSSYSFIRHLFERSNGAIVHGRIHAVVTKLELARQKFDFEQKAILARLYSENKYDGKPSDEIFLIYYFIFSVIELSKEIEGCLAEYVGKVSGSQSPLQAKKSGLKNWFDFFWVKKTTQSRSISSYGSNTRRNSSLPKIFTGPEIGHHSKTQIDTPYLKFLQSQTNDSYRHYLKSPIRKRAHHNAPSSSVVRVGDSMKMSSFLRYRLKIWHLLSKLQNSFNMKFALKTSVLVTVISTIAHLPLLSEFFRTFRLQWSLISIVVVLSPTIGGTNLAGVYRIFGTLIGAFYAYIADVLINSISVDGHAVCGKWYSFGAVILFSIPCFYIFLYSNYPRVGQVSLVSVCSVLLADEANKRNASWTTNVEDLATRQGLVVSSGIIIGLFVNWYIWPYEARVELRKGVSDLLLNMGILYSRLVEVFSSTQQQAEETESEESPSYHGASTKPRRRITASTLHNYYYEFFDPDAPEETLSYFLAFESKLQLKLMHLNQLVPLTWLEPRLKGPFPVEVYQQMLDKCMAILDQFVAMRIALSNHLQMSSSLVMDDERDKGKSPLSPLKNKLSDLILGPAHTGHMQHRKPSSTPHLFGIVSTLVPHRKELVGAVLQTFYMYSASLILKQPLPTYLPAMKVARKRLLEHMHRLMFDRKTFEAFVAPGSKRIPLSIAVPENFINFYAYSLAMEDVISELEALGNILKSLFGEMFADVVNMSSFIDPESLTASNNGKLASLISSPLPTVSHQSERARRQLEAARSIRPFSNRPNSARNNFETDDREDAVNWWRSSGAWMI